MKFKHDKIKTCEERLKELNFKDEKKIRAFKLLRKWITPKRHVNKKYYDDGTDQVYFTHNRVYTFLNHVSNSGMLRAITVCVPGTYKGYDTPEEPAILDISYQVATLLDEKIHKKGGVTRSGCGMDMGFDIVYNLSWILFDEAYLLNQSWI